MDWKLLETCSLGSIHQGAIPPSKELGKELPQSYYSNFMSDVHLCKIFFLMFLIYVGITGRQSKKVFAALTNKIPVHFSSVQMNAKILRTSFSPVLLPLFLSPHISQSKHHAVLDRLALCILV